MAETAAEPAGDAAAAGRLQGRKIRFYRYRLGQYVLDHRPDADDATVVALVLDDRLPKHSAITPDALLEIDATVQRILRDEYEAGGRARRRWSSGHRNHLPGNHVR